MPAYLVVLVLGVLVGVTGGAGPEQRGATAVLTVATVLPGQTPPTALPATGLPPAAQAPSPTPPAAPAPANLPVIEYWTSPRGFPPDPAPRSTAVITTGLRPLSPLVAYDAPGGKPRAILPTSISGVPVTVPIVSRRVGWVAVLLPSVNRTVGWLPAGRWMSRPLPDQLVLHRRTHELTWLRHGARKSTWTVAVGAPATPTPLGRTFVLGRTRTDGAAYAGLDALALGSVPDDRQAVSPGLRRAHTGIHGWYRTSAFGRSVSNGCIRVPGAGQRALLRNIAPGTAVIVVE
jgi:hypothetical protein